MRFSRVQNKLLVGYALSQLMLVFILGWGVSWAIGQFLIGQTQAQMQTLALALDQHIAALPDKLASPSLLEHLEGLERTTGFRLTLIQSDGTVVVDSHKGSEDIGPHAHRTEITEARQAGVGFAERYSSTLGMPTMYFALRVSLPKQANRDRHHEEEIAFIRVANSSTAVWKRIRSYQFWWWSLLLGLSSMGLLAMASHFAWTLLPFHEFLQAAKRGALDPVPNLIGRRDEWGELADSFRYLQTALSKRELSAMEYSDKMETVLASMKEGIIAIDGTDQILLANPAAKLILNMDDNELVGRKLFDILRSPELSNAIEKTRTEQSFAQAEFRSTHHLRRTINARTTPMLGSGLAPSTTGNNSQSGAVIVLSDVTEMRQLESMRQDFVANVSHELKTPLASIKAYAETLRLGALYDAPNNMNFVAQIESQADLLHRQIEELLQLARVESGEQNWNIQTVKLNRACKAAVKQFRSQADSRGIAISVRFDPRSPKVQADSDAIRIVLNNLVSNALRYTGRGGTVTLETLQEEKLAIVRVIDTGIGIAPEHHARIFERFYRVDRARSRNSGGTGLGLAIVKHFVQGFGGHIELTSQINQGSTFTIKLPLLD